jgi:hypothetical protein
LTLGVRRRWEEERSSLNISKEGSREAAVDWAIEYSSLNGRYDTVHITYLYENTK